MYAEEKILLKWIKELTVSSYSLEHRLLKEVAEEIRTKCVYNLDNILSSLFEPLPQFRLGHKWVPQFVQRHKQLKVIIERRIKFVQMDRETKLVFEE